MPQPLDQLVADFLALQRNADRTPEEEEEFTRLNHLVVKRVDLVPRGANGRRFAIRKTGDTMATQTDPQLGPDVDVDGDGNPVVQPEPAPVADPTTVQKIDLPGPAKASLVKKLTGLLNVARNATENPTAKVGPEISGPLKSLAAEFGGGGGGGAGAEPKEGDDVKKGEIPEDVTELKALEHIEKAGAKMKAETRKLFQEHVTGLQKILKDLEADPATRAMLAALTPIAKSFGASADAMAGALKLLTEQRSVDPTNPNPEPAPVPAGQAQPSAQPIAKADGGEGWGDVCNFDLNAEPDEPTKDKQ